VRVFDAGLDGVARFLGGEATGVGVGPAAWDLLFGGRTERRRVRVDDVDKTIGGWEEWMNVTKRSVVSHPTDERIPNIWDGKTKSNEHITCNSPKPDVS